MLDQAGSGNGWYDAIIELAASTPEWVRGIAALFTELGLLAFPVLFLLAWWRARGGGRWREVALAILAPLATGVAYLVSEVSKVVIEEERPCRELVRATVLECPEPGDWSLPSNHATIAAAGAVGLALACRRWWPWVTGLAVLMAFSRVFVGVHYPHDVLVGLLLGAVVAAVAVHVAIGPATGLVRRLASRPVLGTLLARRTPDPDQPTRQLPSVRPARVSREPPRGRPRRR